MKIKNPIFKGFNPDPSICRKGDDFYCAVSSFEWFPGIPVYHSKDLKNWELLTHILTKKSQVDLRKLSSAKGIWAPCLTYCKDENMFYIVYGVMNSMNARYFDCNNYVMKAENIEGSWSEPVYIHSAGFDASMFHDDDGRKYVCSLEWETRDGYEKPGAICLCEYSAKEKKPLGYPKRIWTGGTDRGCIEAPHITKKNGWYYIMCAEGGTGYGHSVTMGRSKNVFGPYEADPCNPIITSIPGYFYERHDPDHLKPKYYNPDSVLQKSGHGSYVDLPNGETYLVHLCSRPFVPELRCTLGRETSIQKMKWTNDGWLRKYDDDCLASVYCDMPDLPEVKLPQAPKYDDFGSGKLGNWYYAPRVMPESFAEIDTEKKCVKIRGQESLCSLNEVSVLARKLTGVYGRITTKMNFNPEVYQHSAGLVIYYDNMNYVYLRKYFSETLNSPAIGIIQLENGEKSELLYTRTAVPEGDIYFKLILSGKTFSFEWSLDGKSYTPMGGSFDTTKLSDEYCKYGEFTGTFVGMTCQDTLYHSKTADFIFFDYEIDEDTDIK